MIAVYIVVAVLVLCAIGYWIRRNRDTGTHDQVPFGEPVFTDDAPDRAER
ncbi:MAG: hypothetical protein ACJ72D_16700 [Marmoricola sp.]